MVDMHGAENLDPRGVRETGQDGPPTDPQPALVAALTEFARKIATGYELSDVLHDLTAQVGRLLAIAGAGVSLIRDDGLYFVTCDSERYVELERLQEAENLNEARGPCVEAARTGEEVLVVDLAGSADRWPRYAQVGARLGIQSVAALPLRADTVVGTFELYDDVPHEWSEAELRLARVFADIAAGYLRGASALEHQRRISDQLQHALDSRVVIEQAKGVIAARRDIGVDEAFRILRKYANDHGATLRAVAEAVVSLGLRV